MNRLGSRHRRSSLLATTTASIDALLGRDGMAALAMVAILGFLLLI